MTRKLIAALAALLLLFTALPGTALPNPVVPYDSAEKVYDDTGLLLPLPVAAMDVSYSVIGGTLAQAEFTYGGTPYTLRQEKQDAISDISGIYETFSNIFDDEEFAAYQCREAYSERYNVAWWYDQARGATGSLSCSSDGVGSFDRILYEIFGGLTRGAGYAGRTAAGREGFSLDIPIVQTESAELTARIRESLLQGVENVLGAFAQDASFAQDYMSASFAGKVFSAEWSGTVSAPGAAYEDYHIFSLHINLETGEPAPLRTLVDTDALAKATYPSLTDFVSVQDWENGEINDAQKQYIRELTQEDWAALLKGADFPAEGFPAAFSAWRDDDYNGGYEDDDLPCLITYVGVPHALQNQITLVIPFDRVDMNLRESIKINAV